MEENIEDELASAGRVSATRMLQTFGGGQEYRLRLVCGHPCSTSDCREIVAAACNEHLAPFLSEVLGLVRPHGRCNQPQTQTEGPATHSNQ